MNQAFEQFRTLQAEQEKKQDKIKVVQNLGRAFESAIKDRLDEMELRHPEICDKILELHLLLMYEVNPALEPKIEGMPSEIPSN